MNVGRERNFGLDVARALAILLVVFGHMIGIVNQPRWLLPWSRGGGLGVDLFFALSGFLIGGIILKLLENQQLNDIRGLARFWSRRWLRTLPAFYFFLLLSVKLNWQGLATLTDHKRLFFFLQNFSTVSDYFFLQAWSLAVEEWFYLLFPLVYALLASAGLNRKRSFFLTVLLFLTLPLALRMFKAPQTTWDTYNSGLRMTVAYRLDAIMPGVAMAAVYRYRISWWNAIRRWSALPIVGAIALYIYCVASVPALVESYVIQVGLFTVTNVTFALLLPFFHGVRTLRWPWLNAAATWTSRISYSMYLGHLLAFALIQHYLEARGVWADVNRAPEILYLVNICAVYGMAHLSYFFIERPFLILRDRTSMPGKWSSLSFFRHVALPVASAVVITFSGDIVGAFQQAVKNRRGFHVRIIEGHKLIYSATKCTEQMLEAKFFVHVYPLTGEAPINRDFRASELSPRPQLGGPCEIIVALPDFAISEVHFGQFELPDGVCCRNLWETVVVPDA